MIMQPHKNSFVIAPLGAVETKGIVIGGLAAKRYAADKSHMSRNRTVTVLILTIICGSIAFGGVKRLSSYDKKHLLEKDTFEVVVSTKEIPATVQNRFSMTCRESTFSMANPGEEYQETDVVENDSLPSRRLVFAARSTDHFLIHFEKGGFGHSYIVVLFRLTDTSVRFVWGASCEGASFKDMLELITAIRNDKVDDELPYLW